MESVDRNLCLTCEIMDKNLCLTCEISGQSSKLDGERMSTSAWVLAAGKLFFNTWSVTICRSCRVQHYDGLVFKPQLEVDFA